MRAIALPLILFLLMGLGVLGCTSKPPAPPKPPDGDEVAKKPKTYDMGGVQIK